MWDKSSRILLIKKEVVIMNLLVSRILLDVIWEMKGDPVSPQVGGGPTVSPNLGGGPVSPKLGGGGTVSPGFLGGGPLYPPR